MLKSGIVALHKNIKNAKKKKKVFIDKVCSQNWFYVAVISTSRVNQLCSWELALLPSSIDNLFSRILEKNFRSISNAVKLSVVTLKLFSWRHVLKTIKNMSLLQAIKSMSLLRSQNSSNYGHRVHDERNTNSRIMSLQKGFKAIIFL
mgnify:FL=1